MNFKYLKDPLFLFVVVLYLLNRFIFKPYYDSWFFNGYLNDLICIPFCLPIMLYGMKLFKIRRHDNPPQMLEIVIPLILWSLIFEILLPLHPYMTQYVVGDPIDILVYCVGAMISVIVWHFTYSFKPLEELNISEIKDD